MATRFAAPLLLVAFSSAVQACLIARAVLPAQDAVRYVAAAQRMQATGFVPALQDGAERPLFPWLMGLVKQLLPAEASWALAAQLTAAVGLVLAAVPVYFLLVATAGRRAALLGGLLFCGLQSFARLGADGLADGLYLALNCAALWAGAHAWIRPHEMRWLILSGGVSALALLVRSESLLLPCALAAALGCSAIAAGEWRARTKSIACLAGGWLAIVAPYLALAGAFSPELWPRRLVSSSRQDESQPLNGPTTVPTASRQGWKLPNGDLMSFARKEPGSARRTGWLAAVQEFQREGWSSLKVFWVLAGIGFYRGINFRRRPVALFSLTYSILGGAAVVAGAARFGYLEERHLLPFVVPLLGWVGRGAVEAAVWLHFRFRPIAAGKVGMPPWQKAAFAVAGVCILSIVGPLHASHAAHRDAARWLLAQPDAGRVLDTRGWTALITGRCTYRYALAREAFNDERLEWVIVEESELRSESARAKSLCALLNDFGRHAATFDHPTQAGASVAAYRWQPLRFAEARAPHAR